MQALIDFDGWRQWKDFVVSKPRVNSSVLDELTNAKAAISNSSMSGPLSLTSSNPPSRSSSTTNPTITTTDPTASGAAAVPNLSGLTSTTNNINNVNNKGDGRNESKKTPHPTMIPPSTIITAPTPPTSVPDPGGVPPTIASTVGVVGVAGVRAQGGRGAGGGGGGAGGGGGGGAIAAGV